MSGRKSSNGVESARNGSGRHEKSPYSFISSTETSHRWRSLLDPLVKLFLAKPNI